MVRRAATAVFFVVSYVGGLFVTALLHFLETAKKAGRGVEYNVVDGLLGRTHLHGRHMQLTSPKRAKDDGTAMSE